MCSCQPGACLQQACSLSLICLLCLMGVWSLLNLHYRAAVRAKRSRPCPQDLAECLTPKDTHGVFIQTCKCELCHPNCQGRPMAPRNTPKV